MSDQLAAEMTRNAFLGPQWVDRSADIDQLLPAYANALANVQDLVADEEANIEGKNGGRGYSYKYADLPQTIGYLRQYLAGHGLAVSTVPTTNPGGQGLAMYVTLIHAESGQWLTFAPLVMPAAGGAQAIGSAITYARRYALTAVLGMAVEDDDGAQATEAARRTQQQGQQQRRPAQRAEGQGGGGGGQNRTPEERTIRAMLSAIRDDDARARAQAAFRDRFGATLAGLDAGRHVEALDWMRAYMQNGQRPPVDNSDEADAAWVEQAKAEATPEERERMAAVAQQRLQEAGLLHDDMPEDPGDPD